MKLEYNLDISGLEVINDEGEQFDCFFYQGHPVFVIPDFGQAQDIWLGFLYYLEKENGEAWDQDGGEITSHRIIGSDGLTKCTYEAYGISFDEDDEPKDYVVDIEGYVIRETSSVGVGSLDHCYFLAKTVKIK